MPSVSSTSVVSIDSGVHPTAPPSYTTHSTDSVRRHGNLDNYSDVIEDVLTDGIHLHVTTGPKLLQTALAKLGMACDIERSDINPAYIAVQKHLPSDCYTCGDTTHQTALYTTTKNFCCSFCNESNSHTGSVSTQEPAIHTLWSDGSSWPKQISLSILKQQHRVYHTETAVE